MALIRGTNLADTRNGTTGNDYIFGLLGDDLLRGGMGNDFLIGGAGADLLYGQDGHDTLRGGAGADQLDGGLGNDMLDGGFDFDRDVLNAGDGDDYVAVRQKDVASGGAGEDGLTLSLFDPTSTTPILYTIDLSHIHEEPAASIGYADIEAGGFEYAYVSLVNAAPRSSVVGSVGDDMISGGVIEAGGVVGIRIDGREGDDILSGTNKNDTITGGFGTDMLLWDPGADTLYGGMGSDVFGVGLATDSFGEILPHQVDIIRDFRANADFFLIGVDALGVGGFEAPSPLFNVDQNNPLQSGSDPVANSAFGQFLYDTDDGRLFYDPDGTGADAAVHLFTLAGAPVITANNFILDF